MKFTLAIPLAIVAAATVAACGSSSSPQFSPSESLARSAAMRGAAAFGQMLFETDPGTGDVDVFSLPRMKLKQQLKGFKLPTAACSDGSSNIWIGNYMKHEMLEYSYTGRLVNTIKRAHLDPYGCAVDPVSEAVAVTNFDEFKFKAGEILIFSGPSGRPIIFRNPAQAYYYNVASDPFGDLWATGFTATGHPVISKCGASSCQTVKLRGGRIFSPGPIAWDGTHGDFIIFDKKCRESATTCSYPVSDDGVLGAPTTYLNPAGGALCNLTQAAIVATGQRKIAIVGGDNEHSCAGHKKSSVDFWKYPQGGLPASHNDRVSSPWSAAVNP